MRELKCTSCGEKLDHCAGAGLPAPGDANVCLHCAAVSEFTDELTLRPLDFENAHHVSNEDRAMLRAMVKDLRARSN